MIPDQEEKKTKVPGVKAVLKKHVYLSGTTYCTLDLIQVFRNRQT